MQIGDLTTQVPSLWLVARYVLRAFEYAEAAGELVQAVELAPQDLFLLSLKLSLSLAREAQKSPAERNLAAAVRGARGRARSILFRLPV